MPIQGSFEVYSEITWGIRPRVLKNKPAKTASFLSST